MIRGIIRFMLRQWQHICRLGLLGTASALLMAEYNSLAFGVLFLLLIWNFFFFLRSREFEEEKPYRILSIRILDMFLSVSMLGTILYRETAIHDAPWPKLLVIGWSFLLIRLVAYPIFAVSLIRESKDVGYSSPWSRLARFVITLTTMSYVLNIAQIREIMIVIMMLLLFGSSVAFLYRYYRDASHRRPLSLASQITVSRIALTPVFIWVFFPDNDMDYSNNALVFKILAFAMVVFFMLTDFLDGYLARKMNEVTTLGKYLDPFSDKVSNFTIFLCFMASGYASIWMVALIYFREASVETLRTLAASNGVVIAARTSGKWKTAIQGVGILLILAGAILQNWLQTCYPMPGFWENYAWGIMFAITTVTIVSGIDYFVASKELLKKYL